MVGHGCNGYPQTSQGAWRTWRVTSEAASRHAGPPESGTQYTCSLAIVEMGIFREFTVCPPLRVGKHTICVSFTVVFLYNHDVSMYVCMYCTYMGIHCTYSTSILYTVLTSKYTVHTYIHIHCTYVHTSIYTARTYILLIA